MDILLGSSVCLSLPHSEQRPQSVRMSSSGLTSEAQLRYILEWFGEFSELQREDFLPVLAAARSGQPDLLASTLATLSCEDKPISLFQCRIKLFNEWYPSWAEEERDRLLKGVTDTDATFAARLQEILVNGGQNGDANSTDGSFVPEDSAVAPEALTNGNHEVEVVIENGEALGVHQDNVPVEIAATS